MGGLSKDKLVGEPGGGEPGDCLKGRGFVLVSHGLFGQGTYSTISCCKCLGQVQKSQTRGEASCGVRWVSAAQTVAFPDFGAFTAA